MTSNSNQLTDKFVSSSSSNEMDQRLRQSRMYLPQYSQFYGNPIWSHNPIQSNLAATQIQKNMRGKLTRSRLNKYKSWKGIDAFDQVMYGDEDMHDYLTRDNHNFIVQLPNSENYEALNLDDIFSILKIDDLQNYFGIEAYNMFYECKQNNQSLRAENINKDVEYIKIGSSNIVVVKPDWLYKGSIIPEPKVFKLVKYKVVNALASIKVLDYMEAYTFMSELKMREEAARLQIPIEQVDIAQFGVFLSADHCNHTHPIQTYKLELLNETNFIQEYLDTLAEYDTKSDEKKIIKGSKVEWIDKRGKTMKGTVVEFTSKGDKCRVCCKSGKNMGDKNANYLIEIFKLKLLQNGRGKKNTRKKKSK